MAVFRVDLLVEDPYPVFDWLDKNVPVGLVRKMAYDTVTGWHMKIVFKNRDDAERFHRNWLPESKTHTVPPFGESI